MKHVIVKTSAKNARYILRKARPSAPPPPMAFYVEADATDEPTPKPSAYVTLQKAQAVENKDGVLTTHGHRIATTYAKDWVAGVRNIALEREYRDLDLLFYDIRADPETARAHASG